MSLPSPQEMLDLTGKAVVVTGASGGIGRGIVRRLSRAGASVVIHHRSSPESASILRADAPADRTTIVQADLTSDNGPAAVVDACLGAFGRIDGLVNNAGVQAMGELTTMDDATWQEMIDTNLTAVHRCTQTAAQAMGEGGGSVIHIASIEGTHPASAHGHYAVSKAGVIMHARAAASELGPSGVRINVVSPGLIHRPGIEDQWPEGVERWSKAAPLRRMGRPEDVGDACVFLISDLSRWITGAELVVDGGVTTRPTW